jgi:hypothetical protein
MFQKRVLAAVFFALFVFFVVRSIRRLITIADVHPKD